MTDAVEQMRLGFTRGTSPSKWADRWHQATRTRLQLVPFGRAFGRPAAASSDGGEPDVMLERALPGVRPEGSTEPRTRHAVRLYDEATALVVPAGHELAGQDRVTLEDLALVDLLDHAHHAPEWPAPRSWGDPEWKPQNPDGALELVATGAGAILLPLPLARHLVSKRDHAVITVAESAGLPGAAVWATWRLDRDAEDVQHLIGVLRGRTARSGR